MIRENLDNMKGDAKSRATRYKDKKNPARAYARIVDDEYAASNSDKYDEVHVGGAAYSLKNRTPKKKYTPQTKKYGIIDNLKKKK